MHCSCYCSGCLACRTCSAGREASCLQLHSASHGLDWCLYRRSCCGCYNINASSDLFKDLSTRLTLLDPRNEALRTCSCLRFLVSRAERGSAAPASLKLGHRRRRSLCMIPEGDASSSSLRGGQGVWLLIVAQQAFALLLDPSPRLFVDCGMLHRAPHGYALG